MTKHGDPRSGETTYRLTNVVQAEPARSLFEVPADYTMKEPVIRRQSPMQPHDSLHRVNVSGRGGLLPAAAAAFTALPRRPATRQPLALSPRQRPPT